MNAEISLLPKCVKQISRFLFLCKFALYNGGTEMLKRIALGFVFSVVCLIQSQSVITPPQSTGHQGSIQRIFKAQGLLHATCHKIKQICIHPIKCNFHTILRTKSDYFMKNSRQTNQLLRDNNTPNLHYTDQSGSELFSE